MPCIYVIDDERRLVLTTAWGVLTYEEAKTHQDALFNDPDFDRSYDQIIDAQGVTSIAFSLDEAKALARRPMFSHSSRRAVVAQAPSVFATFRFMETHHELASGVDQTNVFRDSESALIWLGKDPFSISKSAGQ